MMHTIELVLKRDCDHGHEDGLEVQKNVRRALQSKYQGTDGLQYTESGNTLLVEEIAVLAIVALLLIPRHELTNDAKVGVAELLTERNSKRCEFRRKDLDKILHDIGQSIHVDFVSKFEELLHNLGNVGLHVGSDDIVTNKGLESEGSSHTHREAGVGH